MNYILNIKIGFFQFSLIKLLNQINKMKILAGELLVGTGTSVNKAKHTPFYFLTSACGWRTLLSCLVGFSNQFVLQFVLRLAKPCLHWTYYQANGLPSLFLF